MNSLKVFENQEFGKIRISVIQSEPWFVGKDVAEILGYQRTADAIRAHVDVEDKGVGEIQTPGGTQTMTVINESGLYSLILSSKLPTAKRFKRWVTGEVLPAIRKHGAYLTEQKVEEILTNPDTIIKLATRLKEEREARKQAEAQSPEGHFRRGSKRQQDQHSGGRAGEDSPRERGADRPETILPVAP